MHIQANLDKQVVNGKCFKSIFQSYLIFKDQLDIDKGEIIVGDRHGIGESAF